MNTSDFFPGPVLTIRELSITKIQSFRHLKLKTETPSDQCWVHEMLKYFRKINYKQMKQLREEDNKEKTHICTSFKFSFV